MLVATFAFIDEPHVLPVRPVPTRALEAQAPTVGRRTLREATTVASMRHLRDLAPGYATVRLPVLDIHLPDADETPRNTRRPVPGPEERRQHEIRDLQLSRRELPPRTYPPEQRTRLGGRPFLELRLRHVTLSKNKQPKTPLQAPSKGYHPATKLHKVVHINKTSDQKLCKNADLSHFLPCNRPLPPSDPKNAQIRPKNRQRTQTTTLVHNPPSSLRSPSPCTPTLYYPLTSTLPYNLNYLRNLITLKYWYITYEYVLNNKKILYSLYI